MACRCATNDGRRGCVKVLAICRIAPLTARDCTIRKGALTDHQRNHDGDHKLISVAGLRRIGVAGVPIPPVVLGVILPVMAQQSCRNCNPSSRPGLCYQVVQGVREDQSGQGAWRGHLGCLGACQRVPPMTEIQVSMIATSQHVGLDGISQLQSIKSILQGSDARITSIWSSKTRFGNSPEREHRV